MSEAEKSVEVEDVLSSIRRLVADVPRVEENKSHLLNLAASRIEPPLTAPQDIDEAMEELPIEDDIQVDEVSFVPEEDVLEISEDAITPLPEIEAPDPDGPITFVQAINASIAEMSKGQDTSKVSEQVVMPEETPSEEPASDNIAELPEDADTDARTAHVNAFLANETWMPSELNAPEIAEPEVAKPAPFVLRPDMAATDAEEVAIEELSETEDSQEFDAAVAFEDDIPEDIEDMQAQDDIDDDDMEFTTEEQSDDNFIDEETLREIVGELVRAELQGDLGDRITRNVRKLVRREIHHALASRDIP